MDQRLQTRLTKLLNIEHPILLAPMDVIAGGRLAAAVSSAGGLGLIGGGYGEREWVESAFAEAGNQDVGIGFITWSVQRDPELVDFALSRKPKAMMVSFGDGEDIVEKARAQGTPTIWQIHRLSQAEQALRARTDVLVVQGQEGGGHGMDRGLTSLLPAVRDRAGPDQVIVAPSSSAAANPRPSAIPPAATMT